MADSAHSGRAVGQLSAARLREGNEIRQVLGRYVGPDDQKARDVREQADRLEILFCILRQLLEYIRRGRMRARRPDEKRVAIRPGLCDAMAGPPMPLKIGVTNNDRR